MNQLVRNSLEQANNTSNSTKMYKILDKNGLVYSQFLGWGTLNNNTYGHIFTKEESSLVLSILREHGYTDVRTELDKVGTLFAATTETPFGNPSKMVHLLLFTVIFFVALYITLNTGLMSTIVDQLKTK